MIEDQIIEPADFLDFWGEKQFLGQEFLTWLWIVSEISGNLLNLKPLPPHIAPQKHNFPEAVELWFESRLTLESGEGGDRKVVTCQYPTAQDYNGQWAEAHTALRHGKKLTKARLKVVTEEKEWGLTLVSDTLTPKSVKLPKTFIDGVGEADCLAERLLERMALMGELTNIVAALFHEFLLIRLSQDWETHELPRLNRWLDQK